MVSAIIRLISGIGCICAELVMDFPTLVGSVGGLIFCVGCYQRGSVGKFGSNSVSTSGPPLFKFFKMTFTGIEIGTFSLEDESAR